MDYLTFSNVFAAIVGGLTMGFFLARSAHFHPLVQRRLSTSIIMCTFGLAFIIPLAVGEWVQELMGGGVPFTPEFWLAAVILWCIYSIHTAGGERISEMLAERKRICEECDEHDGH